MIDRARNAQRQAFMQHLIVPKRLIVRMQHDMRVALDEPWQKRSGGKIDDLRAIAVDACGGSCGRNALAVHSYGPALLHLFPIEYAGGSKNDWDGRLSLRPEPDQRHEEEKQSADVA